MASPERRNQPSKHTATRTALAFAVGFGGVAGIGLTAKTVIDGLSRPKASAVETVDVTPTAFDQQIRRITPTVSPAPEVPVIQLPVIKQPEATKQVVLEQPSPAAKPTEAPKPTAAATPPPTEPPRPITTVTASPTATATETPKPPEKSPLPSYGGSWGSFSNEKTGAKEGVITIASIPQSGQPEQILVYYIRTDNRLDAILLDLKSVQGQSFEATNPGIPGKRGVGTHTLKASIDSTGKVLIGTIEMRQNLGEPPYETLKFQTSFVGTGKAKVEEAAKKMKLSTGKYGNVDWTQVRIDELQKVFHIELP